MPIGSPYLQAAERGPFYRLHFHWAAPLAAAARRRNQRAAQWQRRGRLGHRCAGLHRCALELGSDCIAVVSNWA